MRRIQQKKGSILCHTEKGTMKKEVPFFESFYCYQFVLGDAPKSFVPRAFFSRRIVRVVFLRESVLLEAKYFLSITTKSYDTRYFSSVMNLS